MCTNLFAWYEYSSRNDRRENRADDLIRIPEKFSSIHTSGQEPLINKPLCTGIFWDFKFIFSMFLNIVAERSAYQIDFHANNRGGIEILISFDDIPSPQSIHWFHRGLIISRWFHWWLIFIPCLSICHIYWQEARRKLKLLRVVDSNIVHHCKVLI